MIKIAICDTAPDGACSYYRSLGVLPKLRHINNNIHVEYVETISWYQLSQFDILFLIRPVEENLIRSMEMAKNFGIKLWIDFDDCLHNIPEDNPNYKYFKTRLPNMEKSLEMADVVTVSTQFIKDYYSNFNDNIIVVENAFNDYNYSFDLLDYNNKKADFISWRGSTTHRKDLLSCQKAIHDIANANPSWGWIFVGNEIWYITDTIKNHYHLNEVDIISYNKFISELNPSIHIVPLLGHDFNMSKSNIAWIEGTWAGAATLAPSLPEFEKSGIVNYKPEDNDNFGYYLEKMIHSKKFRKEKYEESYEYIKGNLMLSEINKKRIDIVDGLMHNTFKRKPKMEKKEIDLKDFFIAIYTHECKQYCDEQFYGNLLSSDIGEATIEIVDNSPTEEYSHRLKELTGKDVHHIEVPRDTENMQIQFLKNVTESVLYLRDLFLKSDCQYFVIIESDVIPPKEFLHQFYEVIEKADIIGGIYYAGFHAQELFDTPGFFQPTHHVLSGCTLYKREVIEKIPFRWSEENLNAFPDAWISYDATHSGNNFKLANYSSVRCQHLMKNDNSRGHEEIR